MSQDGFRRKTYRGDMKNEKSRKYTIPASSEQYYFIPCCAPAPARDNVSKNTARAPSVGDGAYLSERICGPLGPFELKRGSPVP